MLMCENARIKTIDVTNAGSLARIAQFREAYRIGKVSYADFSVLKQKFPFLGLVPCRAADLDFVMFHAHDDVVAWHYLWFGADGYEADIVRRWVEWCREPGIVMDIGGYSGLMSVLAALAHRENKIHLFEPIDRTIERANVNVKINGLVGRVTLHHRAASDRAGEQTINLYRDENFLGTGNSIHEKAGLKIIDRKIINSVVLDDYLPDIRPRNVKIDVEGHELACLRGMWRIIEAARPRMVIEVWEHDREEVLAMLRDIGYRMSRVEGREWPVNNYFAEP